MRIQAMRTPPLQHSDRGPITKSMVAGALLLMLLSATGGGLAVDAYRWRTEAPAAITVLDNKAASPKETREAIVVLQFNVQAAIDALRATANRDDENSVHARNALHWIAERAR